MTVLDFNKEVLRLNIQRHNPDVPKKDISDLVDVIDQWCDENPLEGQLIREAR